MLRSLLAFSKVSITIVILFCSLVISRCAIPQNVDFFRVCTFLALVKLRYFSLIWMQIVLCVHHVKSLQLVRKLKLKFQVHQLLQLLYSSRSTMICLLRYYSNLLHFNFALFLVQVF